METHRASGRNGLGLALASVTMVLWGVLPLALREALHHVDAITLTGFRMTVAALVLGVLLAARRGLPRLRTLTRPGPLLLGVATLGLAANYIGFLLGLAGTTPANAQVLIQLGPLLLGIGGLALFGERYAPAQWLGFALLVAGLGLFFGGQVAALASGLAHYLAGVAWLVFAAATWAVYGLAQKQLLLVLPSQGIMLCIYVGCAACFVPFSAPSALYELPASAWALLLFCAINTLVAYGAFAAALEHWEASRVSAVLALTPLATLGFSVLAGRLLPGRVAPEALSLASLLGAGLVVGGSLLTALGRRADPGRS